ncbi:hypothetical protein B0T17DRAFT_593639 [Bombardia bombarda]|uniref:Oxidation resistance protein 1 n=1 Tax=Bombardia bombarda TaxID=252184 RepID=A0AA39TRN8_9PEZI|nr:hypothetical protein B0T17DRAFT_593639 [Bombardia bombarda]
MSYYASQRKQILRSRSFESDSSPSHSTPSSGAVTPTGLSASASASASAGSSTYLPSTVSSLWGGLFRRFSSDTSQHLPPTSSSTPSSLSSSLHHAHTFPADDSDDLIMRNNGIDGVFTPPRVHRTPSPMRPPPLEPLQLNGFAEDTPEGARLLTPAIAEEIRIMVPTRLSIVDEWNLVYSLDQDGASLATLYEKCAAYRGRRVGFVLVVKDHEGGIFGAYLSDYPRPHPKYFGTGECFLWHASFMASLPPPPSADTTHLTSRTTTIASAGITPQTANQASLLSPTHTLLPQPSSTTATTAHPHPPASPSIRFKAFPYSGVNEYYMLCEAHFLSVGAGDGRYGLWLDDGLERGISSTCLTFGNERLSDEGEKFGILGVEVWVVGAGDGGGFIKDGCVCVCVCV